MLADLIKENRMLLNKLMKMIDENEVASPEEIETPKEPAE